LGLILTMDNSKTLLFILLLISSAVLIRCGVKTDSFIYCNHISQRDTLSYLDYHGIDFNTNFFKSKNFKLEFNSVPDNFQKIDDKHLIMLLTNNIVINGYQNLELSMRSYHKLDLATKLILKFNKNTISPEKFKPIDYHKFFPDTTYLINDFYLLGKLELSNEYDSYVIINQHDINELDGVYFERNETSYYLLNMDHNKKLISTIQLAYFRTDSDGLSYSMEKLELRFILKYWLCFFHSSYIKSLDLPNTENKQKTRFTLRINRKGEIK
jgi:hypothetical protein